MLFFKYNRDLVGPHTRTYLIVLVMLLMAGVIWSMPTIIFQIRDTTEQNMHL